MEVDKCNESQLSYALEMLKSHKKKIKKYITDDTAKKENFTGIKIVRQEDDVVADEEVNKRLRSYTLDDCRKFVANIEV